MKQNLSRKPSKLAALFAGAALLGLVSHGAMAAGTLSNTDITNLAKLSYAVGGIAQNEICSSPTGNSVGNGGTTGTTCTSGTNGASNTSFTVDNKVNLTVAEVSGSASSVLPGSTSQVTGFTVTNTGNTAQGYNLAAANFTPPTNVFGVADTFDVTNLAIRVDSNGNGIFEPLLDTATAISTLAPDATVTVFVLGDIPLGSSNGTQAVVTLTATTTTDGTTTPVVETGANTAGVDIVFADPANAATDPLAANTARDAIGIAQDAYLISSATISVAKTATLLCDPFNGTTNPKNIPGAIVQYTITVSNTGTASATLSSIIDALDVNSTFEPGTATGPSAPTNAATCVAGPGGSGFNITSSAVGRALGGTSGNMTNTNADADGAAFVNPNATIDFATALPAGGTYAAGELKPGESATVKFNVTIN
jgi:uncharacterized repeat protein (TIGR01451 family)